MGFAESIKKVIGIEELDDDENDYRGRSQRSKRKNSERAETLLCQRYGDHRKKPKPPMSSSSSKASESAFLLRTPALLNWS